MRVFYKIIFTLLAVILSLHHVCNWNRCSRDLQQICYYTTPSTWDEILASRNEFYHDNIHYVYLEIQDQYERYVEPVVTEASSRLNERLTRPAIKMFSKIDYDEIERIGELVRGYLSQLGKRVQFYFNVYCGPYLWEMKEKIDDSEFWNNITVKGKQAIILLTEKLIQLKDALSTLLKNGAVQRLVRRSKEEGEAERNAMTKNIVSTPETPFTATPFFANEGNKNGKIIRDNLDNEFSLSDTTGKEEEKEEEETETETETMTITITQTAVVTSSSVVLAISTSLAGVPEGAVSRDKELTKRFVAETVSQASVVDIGDAYVTEEELLQKDFENWSITINKKAKSVVKLFDKEVNRTISKLLEEYNEELATKVKEYSRIAKEHFKKITKATEDIDCREEIDPNTGKKVYFNKEGTSELEQYIHRQLMRDYFSSYSNKTSVILDEINDRLESLTDRVNSSVERLRDEFVDVYEEWGNVMVNEWTKRLAYVDVLAANLGENQDNHLSEENWKNFIEIKKSVIDARNTLINHSAPLSEVARFIKKVQRTLSMLTSENGEYAYILRAKANLAFQKREKEERERAMSMSLEEERRSREREVEEEEAERQKTIKQLEKEEETSVVSIPEATEVSVEQDIMEDQQTNENQKEREEGEKISSDDQAEESTSEDADRLSVSNDEEGNLEKETMSEVSEYISVSQEENNSGDDEEDYDEPISTIKITRTRSVTRTRHS